MSNHVACFTMTIEFLTDALKLAYGMPDDAEIVDVVVEHNPCFQPTVRALLVKVEHPDFREVLEGEQVSIICPRVHDTPDGPKFDWGKR